MTRAGTKYVEPNTPTINGRTLDVQTSRNAVLEHEGGDADTVVHARHIDACEIGAIRLRLIPTLPIE